MKTRQSSWLAGHRVLSPRIHTQQVRLFILALAVAVLGAAAAQGALPDGRQSRAETLWIFDADFEDMSSPNNTGWVSLDRSGTVGQENYWHKDTIRIRNFSWLGDSTWWCGTYNSCWRQPRGYGNDWIQHLYRDFPLSSWSEPGDQIDFRFDQRFALEHDYDYAYVDVSTDGGSSWTTHQSFSNPGFAGKPGMPQDWDSNNYGHRTIDMNAYAGQDVRLRFRMESDMCYSCQDQWDNYSHSVRDGAWQLDNFRWNIWQPDSVLIWYDDCEAPGDNGWVHEDIPTAGQTGVVFRRIFEPETFRGFACNPGHGWMMAAVDSVTGTMVDGQQSWLLRPGIDISGADRLVGQWDIWLDLPEESNDGYGRWPVGNDSLECLYEVASFYLYSTGIWGGPYWTTASEDLSDYAGNDWLGLRLWVWNKEPASPGSHKAGIFVDRVRVGVVVGDLGTRWTYNLSDRLDDTFDVSHALSDLAFVSVRDDDGIAAVELVASGDGGEVWYSQAATHWGENRWRAYAPAQVVAAGREIWYYFAATDSLGNSSSLPGNAPDEHFEFSVLPINGSTHDPGILLVDKHGGPVPGDDRRYRHTSEYYYREALDILGYEYDVYDVPVPGSPDSLGLGPRHQVAYEAYDTHIWFTGDLASDVLEETDQWNLISWLSGSAPHDPHNVLLAGNDIGYYLDEHGGGVGDFLATWLAASYVDRHPGVYGYVDDPDTMIRVRDAGMGLMTYDDCECRLQCACPQLNCFDVVEPAPGTAAAHVALEYENSLGATLPAGVVYENASLGYRSVFLPFGLEYMNEGPCGGGHYFTGIHERVDLMANIMELFEEDPAGPGTGVPLGEDFADGLFAPHPNPFNPLTTVEYGVASEGHVTVRIYSVSGRVVRTLVDGAVGPGSYRATWDGTTDSGERAASGVYFVRLEKSGEKGPFTDVRTVVLLK